LDNKEKNALIPSPSGALDRVGHGPKRILSGIVSDALTLARTQNVQRLKSPQEPDKPQQLSPAIIALRKIPAKQRLEILHNLLQRKQNKLLK